jgi:exopolyphosphatase/pppGpp-phosphohydrolase
MVVSFRVLLLAFISGCLPGLVLADKPAESPPSPVKIGGIEVGATGIKAAVVELTRRPDGGLDFEVVRREERNVSLGTLTPDGRAFTAKALADTREAVKELASEMEKKDGLKPGRIPVVGSSGIFSGFKGNEEAIRGAKAALRKEVEAAGLLLDFVDVLDEARLGAVACIPAPQRGETLLVDIGGGNTKGGYFSKGAFVNFDVEYGTKTFYREAAKAAKKADGPFAEVAEKVGESVVVPKLKEELTRNPGLARTPRAALVGGIMWALATFTHPDKVGERRVEVTTADLERFQILVKDLASKATSKETLEKILAGVGDEKVRERATREIEAVRKVYAPDQLLAGAVLLRTVAKEIRFDTKKQIVFYNAPQAWLVGWLMKKHGVEK